ncbi:MAG: DegV family protein [Lachnospiraceae bacterium]|nr:DegV family protein [Lachnospiraceae bacterium]
MSIAFVTDSNSGITQAEGEKLGISVLPMPFMIDGETYLEDINLTQEKFYEMLALGADISTSQPSPETVTSLWDDLLKEHEMIVHIPMSSGLSGSCQTAMMLAQDYEGRVLVVDNQRISVTQRQSVLDGMEMAKRGFSAEQIKDELERTRFDSVIYIMVDTLKYLKKGGRITPAAAALGTLLRIKPVLIIEGEKLDAFSKARTMKQAKATMLAAVQKDMEVRFHQLKPEEAHIHFAHTQNAGAAAEWMDEVREMFPGASYYAAPLSLSIACHIGPGALAVTCTKKL